MIIAAMPIMWLQCDMVSMSCSLLTCVWKKTPIPTNMAFQSPAPRQVQSMNFQMFIFASPAGMDMSWRIAGIMRPIRVDVAPFL